MIVYSIRYTHNLSPYTVPPQHGNTRLTSGASFNSEQFLPEDYHHAAIVKWRGILPTRMREVRLSHRHRMPLFPLHCYLYLLSRVRYIRYVA